MTPDPKSTHVIAATEPGVTNAMSTAFSGEFAVTDVAAERNGAV